MFGVDCWVGFNYNILDCWKFKIRREIGDLGYFINF